MGFVLSRKDTLGKSPGCLFVPWDEGEDEAVSHTLSSGTPSGIPSFGTPVSLVLYM